MVALAATATTGLILTSRVVTRPLWYDEQWRAYYFAMHGHQFWNDITHANAPSALLYIAVEKLSTGIFGQYPWALRLPAAAAIPVLAVLIYGYARRFTAPPGALLAAVVTAGSSGVLRQALQVKPYLLEAAATVTVLLLWSAARPGRGRRAARVALFTAAGVISCLSVAGIFVIAPLAVGEAVLIRGDLRRRARAFLDALPALAISLLHTGLFVAAQSDQRKSTFWDFAFASGRGIGGGLHFLARGTGQLAAGTFLGFSAASPPLTGVAHLQWVTPTVTVLVLLGWATAAATLWRSRAGRQLLAVAGCILAGTALASALRYWPYGLQRTNIFALPVLAVLAIAGWTVWWRAAWAAARSGARRTGPRRATAPALILPSLLACAGMALLALTGAQLDQWRVDSRNAIYGDQVTRAAFHVRAEARPGQLVAYGTDMAIKGWRWALDDAAGPAGLRRIPPRDQLAFTSYDDGSLAAALKARHGTSRAYVYLAKGFGDASARAVGRQLAAAGWCRVSRQDFPSSGVLDTLRPCRDLPQQGSAQPQGVRSG